MGVESGKATTRIEPDGYKKKLLASQTHLDLQTRATCAHVPVLFSPFSLSFSPILFFALLAISPSCLPSLPVIVSILLSFLCDIFSPFLRAHSLFYSWFIFRLFLFLPLSRDYSSIPLLYTRNLNYKCPSRSAATHGPAFVSGSRDIARSRHYMHIRARNGNTIRN